MCNRRKKSAPIKLSTKSVMHEMIINYLPMIYCLKLNWLTSVINGVLISPCSLCSVTHAEISIYSLALWPRFNFSVKMVFRQRQAAGLYPVAVCGVQAYVVCRCGYWMINQLLVWGNYSALLAEYLRNIISLCLIRISMIRCWYDKAGSAIGTSWKISLMHFLLRGSLIWFTQQRGGLWPKPPVVTRWAGINTNIVQYWC